MEEQQGSGSARVWSTDRIAPRDRRAWWTDELCDRIVRADCEPRGDGQLVGSLWTDSAGEIQATHFSSTAQLIVRSPRNIAQYPTETVTIGIQVTGGGLATQNDNELVLRSGDIVPFDMRRPFALRFDSAFARTTLTVPRSALERRIGNCEGLLGRRIDGSAGVGGLLSPILRELPLHLGGLSDATRERVAESLLDLIATALISDSERRPFSASMTLTRVKAWIAAHLGERLSANRIASQCGLSTRHLNRLIALEGTSLMQYVLEKRLKSCHRDLLDPAMHNRSITDIAFAAGFNDLSHFSRSYRAQYGHSAREARDSRPTG